MNNIFTAILLICAIFGSMTILGLIIEFIFKLIFKKEDHKALVFHTKVVGVTYNNTNGKNRQEIIKKCHAGDDVIHLNIPSKEYPDAIGIFTMQGEQLGYLSKELATEFHTKWENSKVDLSICNITGGGDKTFGCNLEIKIHKH